MRVAPVAVAVITVVGCNRYEYRAPACPEAASHSAVAWQYTGRHPRAVEGAVIAIDSLRPLPSAIVTVASDSRKWPVDTAGRFRLDSLAPGPHTVRIVSPGYTDATSDIVVQETSGVQVVAAMERYRIALDACGAVLLPVRKPWWKLW